LTRTGTGPGPDMDRTGTGPGQNLDRIWIVSLDLTWAPEGESGRLLAATSIPHHQVNLLKTNDQFLLNLLTRLSHRIPM
jgi:hypothetical protein